MLKHWQDLEQGKAIAEAGEDVLGDQQDDDVQDAHTGAADGLDEAESIHSWGMLNHALDAAYLWLCSCG